MASVSAIRDALAANLATITGLRVGGTIPDSVNPPQAIVGAPDVSYDVAFSSAAARYTIPIRVLVGRVSERGAQDKLDGYLAASGAGSVRAAIESDSSLGGLGSARVRSAGGYGVYEVGSAQYLGAEWQVEVIA